MKYSTTMTNTNLAIYAILSLSLTSLSVNAAGPHNRFGVKSHRRHHARAAAASSESDQNEVRSTSVQADIIEKREECTLGAWKCVGSELQRCYNDQWNFVTNCTGTDIICSDGLYTTGCVWTWSVQQNDDVNESATSSPPFTASISATPSTTSTLSVTASITNANLAAEPTVTAGTDEDEEEECDDEEDDQDEQNDDNDDNDDDDNDLPYCDELEEEDTSITPSPTSATPVATTVPASTPSATAIGGNLIAGGNDGQGDEEEGDDEEYEDCDEDSDSDDYASASATSASAASTSIIGGQLWAGDDNSWDSTASATTHDWYSWDNQATATSTSQDWNTWNQATATATASSSQHGHGHGKGHKSSSADWAASTSSSWDQSGDGSWSPPSSSDEWAATTTWDDWSGQPTTTAWGQESSISASGKSGKGSAVASASASASPSSGKSNHTTGSPSGAFTSAPHYVIYSDYWLFEMPSVDVLSNFNRFILAFWMTDRGAVDNAQFWEQLDASTRQQVITDYHNAGIALMVSAFGSTDSPTSNGADPTQTAQRLAKWVKDYGLDGVDIDYEDMPAMNSAQAVAWLVTFQKELRRLLPSPYIISHAPVAPWFTSANDYSDGAYVAIHQQTGDGIDFYNIQFYNQGTGVYEDCNSLLFNSGNDWPSTSVFEINSSAGLPLDKIVIGKPLDEGAAANGFVDPSVLHKCVSQAKAKGWNAGVMFWEWTTSAPSVMGTVRGSN